MKDIARLCVNCLKTKLADDYAQFRAMFVSRYGCLHFKTHSDD
jgi:hypothetical protein